ncbi:MAG: 5-formyltetrahydrofolate cyclo-ligase [Oscillospiraceae bacterium]|nr:5-formyltetrahydrofolate cyclo-ligase [Oscillospiraceae bacterium]
MQSISTAEAKARLRRQIRAKLAAIPETIRLAEDRALFDTFLALPQVQQAECLFLFFGVGTEPHTAPLIETLFSLGKTVALPRMLPGHRMDVLVHHPARPLVQNKFGLWEPAPACPALAPEQIDLVLVPALCYDRQNYRLGMGGGYYDRWLEHYHGITVGLCRSALLVDRLPAESHDRPVDLVLTA